MPPRHLKDSEQLKFGLPRNASRTVIRPTFPVHRIADCQALAAQDVPQTQQRAKLAAASLNRLRPALIVIEADPRVVLTNQETGRSGAPNPRGRHFRAILGAPRQPAKCTVLGEATRDPFRHDKARLSKLRISAVRNACFDSQRATLPCPWGARRRRNNRNLAV